MPIRRHPGRPKFDEPAAPQRQRTIRIPKELDEELVKQGKALGLSPQGVIREAILLWLEAKEGKGRSGE